MGGLVKSKCTISALQELQRMTHANVKPQAPGGDRQDRWTAAWKANRGREAIQAWPDKESHQKSNNQADPRTMGPDGRRLFVAYKLTRVVLKAFIAVLIPLYISNEPGFRIITGILTVFLVRNCQ